ncbi:dTDP-4-dehydrorhamnose 3,5-epimerase [Muriicola marianensis]|uniref:dTDP-4-dehydrorhamnose 3,5-epimerase n=2 Tax=Muriicola marianensis TaxID=1324801 RepID=A0ABQ1R038_9FLAO|nr:dTDP-4-dehydrorhamnose 3,5-epimerase [Muriicola marianensis]
MEPPTFRDRRGLFFESYNHKTLEAVLGRSVGFVQDNHSVSHEGVLRGLHFQTGKHAQAKLVRVVRGEVLDVVVDLRRDSNTYRNVFRTILSESNRKMLFIPKGMAHGFLSLKDDSVFLYKCDEYYNKDAESGIIYNDPDLKIDWGFPENKIILSDKDMKLPKLKDLSI